MGSKEDTDDIFEKGCYYEDSPPLSREQSIEEEYILSESSSDEDENASRPEEHIQRPKKPVIRDIYDENNYTLARPYGITSHDNIKIEEEEKSERVASTSCSKKKITIGIVIGILTVGAIGGVCTLVLLDKQGTCKKLLV